MKAAMYFEAHTQACWGQQVILRYREGGSHNIFIASDYPAVHYRRLSRQRIKFAARVEAALEQRNALLEACEEAVAWLDTVSPDVDRRWELKDVILSTSAALAATIAQAKGRPA